MFLGQHTVVTLIIGGIFYSLTRSCAGFIGLVIGGIFIDIDHVIDYFLQTGINFRIKYFFKWCHELHWDRIFLFLHSIELILLFWIIIFIFNPGIFWTGFVIGVTQHILFDIMFNTGRVKLHILFYLLIFRISKGFRKEFVLRP